MKRIAFIPLLSLVLGLAASVCAELFVSDFNNNVVLRYNETNGAFMDLFSTNNLSQPFGLRFGPTEVDPFVNTTRRDF